MPYTHEIDACFTVLNGAAPLDRATYETHLASTAPILARLKAAAGDGSLPLLGVPARLDDLGPMEDLAEKLIAGKTNVVVLGTGGSSLGTQALGQLTGYGVPLRFYPKGRPRFHVMDNLDPVTFGETLERLPLETTCFITVSKSGGTAQTMAQSLAILNALEKQGLMGDLAHRFAAITEPGDNPLRRLSAKHNMSVIDHDPKIGGRYSVLTSVGVLPMLMMGLDPRAMREGASSVIEPLLAGADPAEYMPAQGAALLHALEEQNGIHTHVLMGYSDRLERFTAWTRQLWAESLGKEGKGSQLFAALGPVDQHSQLQLWREGPADKSYTFITTDCRGEGPCIPAHLAEDPDLALLAGRTIGDLVDAEQQATMDTLVAKSRPVRRIRVKAVDERSMGALFMHFMMETIIKAGLMDVDPFDQPAVEDGKQRARAMLASGK